MTKAPLIAVRSLGGIPRSKQREIFKVLGSERCVVVISFGADEVMIFDGNEDGTVRSWTPLLHDRHAATPAIALRNFGMEAV